MQTIRGRVSGFAIKHRAAHHDQSDGRLHAIDGTAGAKDGPYFAQDLWDTGQRILLDFSVNGTPMDGQLRSEGPPVFSVRADGTDQISLIEVLRSQAGSGVWEVIDRRRPMTEHVEFALEDQEVQGGAAYYVRLRQANLVRGRLVMAWSSPVWVKVP